MVPESLSAEVERAAEAAARFASGDERVSGVLVAEPLEGGRVYVCSFEAEDGRRSWLGIDGAGRPVVSRRLIRDAVSIAALCEIADETAGGGHLDELRSRLLELRRTDNPPGIEEALDALDALRRTVGTPPRLASPGHLDRVGSAARRLEQALGGGGSPFAEAMKGAMPTVEELLDDVVGNYKGSLD